MKATILFGNGINRLSGCNLDWSNLIKDDRILSPTFTLAGCEPSCCNGDYKIPLTLPLTHQYEDLVINAKSTIPLAEYRGLFSEEEQIKQVIIKIIESQQLSEESTSIYKDLLHLDAENYLTTNYDNYFYSIVLEEYNVLQKNLDCYEIYSLNSYKQYRNDLKETKTIWPIHGDISRFKSIILGYDHYCGNLYEIEKYIREGVHADFAYKKFKTLNQKRNCPNYPMYRLKENMNADMLECWVDAFFATDVHIIGLGMDLAETDIWWLLNKRARSKLYGWKGNEEYRGIIKNKIYSYGYYPRYIVDLLKAYDVDVSYARSNKPKDQDEWYDLYQTCIKDCQANIESRNKKSL